MPVRCHVYEAHRGTLRTFRPSWPGPAAHGHTSRACTGEKHERAEGAPLSPAPSAVSHLPRGYSGALEILGHLPRGFEATQSPSDVRASISASCALSRFSCLQLFETLWTADRQLLSMGFSRQEYWRGLPFPSPGDLPHPGIEPTSLIISCTGRWILYHWTPGQPILASAGSN